MIVLDNGPSATKGEGLRVTPDMICRLRRHFGQTLKACLSHSLSELVAFQNTAAVKRRLLTHLPTLCHLISAPSPAADLSIVNCELTTALLSRLAAPAFVSHQSRLSLMRL